MKSPVTASMVYDLIACPHRVTMDLFGDSRERDPASPFVQLLWEKGSLFEAETIAKLMIPFVNLSGHEPDEKERLTTEAMQRGEHLIYGGRIQHDDLLGQPDLLRNESGKYIAGDIKSGAGEAGGDDDRKPKLHYAVQLALYTDILERRGLSAGRRAFVWDVHGEEVTYDLSVLYGKVDPRTLWDDYQDALSEARAIASDFGRTLPAYSSATCKLCHWYSACLKRLSDLDDLTLIPELGRSKRDSMISHIETIHALATIDPDRFATGKKTIFPGVGPDSLKRFQERAQLICTPNAKPKLKGSPALPNFELELYFDIEVDPMRDVCYLHGFVERRSRDSRTEKFTAFFADDPSTETEKTVFSQAWEFLSGMRPCAIYYYSKYERTIYRKLQEKYPEVCARGDIDELFDPTHAVDLYFDVVKKSTEWPTRDYSIKTLATFLNFQWRDTHPSGAASIEWYDNWIRTGDPTVRQRILEYNEDDCIATRVLLDAIRNLILEAEK